MEQKIIYLLLVKLGIQKLKEKQTEAVCACKDTFVALLRLNVAKYVGRLLKSFHVNPVFWRGTETYQ